MTSQNYTPKRIPLRSLMREDLRHKNWMILLSVIGNIFTGPLALYFYFSFHAYNGYRFTSNNMVVNEAGYIVTSVDKWNLKKALDCLYFVNTNLLLYMGAIAFAGALIVGIESFRYLFSRKMVDLYHSAPVTRRKLFTAVWLNGFLIWFVPFFISILLALVAASFVMKGILWGTLLARLLFLVLRLTLCYLTVYHFCIVCVMLCGNLITSICTILYCGICIAAGHIMISNIMNTYSGTFYLSARRLLTAPTNALSPLISPLCLVYYWKQLLSFPVWGALLITTIIIMLFNLILGYYLYQKRPSELAEQGIALKPVRILIRSSATILGGLFCAYLLLDISPSQSLPWILFGIFIGTAFTFCLLNIVCHYNMKQLFSHKLQYLILLFVCAGIYMGMMYDVTGYNTHIPGKSSIISMQLYCDDLCTGDYNFRYSDTGLIRYTETALKDPYAPKFTDQEKIYQFLKNISSIQKRNEFPDSFLQILVNVKTRYGSFLRSYLVTENEYELLKPFVETPEYLSHYYPIKYTGKIPSSCSIRSSFSSSPQITDANKLTELMDALRTDFQEHSTIQDLLCSGDTLQLNMRFPAQNTLAEGTNYYSFSYQIPFWYTHVIELVERWYPDDDWSRPSSPINQLNVRIILPQDSETESTHDALYRFLGFAPDGTVLDQENTLSTGNRIPYTAHQQIQVNIVDPHMLAELEPLLEWGNSYTLIAGLEYTLPVDLGTARFSDGSAELCQIKRGKLPPDILQFIDENCQVHNLFESEFPEEFYNDFVD